MTTVADSKGIVYRLEPRMLGGGEGQIHPVIGRHDLLAKIFDRDMPGYEEKLRWMIAHPPRDPGASSGHRSIAWPREILWDARGNLAGYLMPRIMDAKEIIEAYNPSARKSAFPEFSRLALHRAALNFVHVVQAVHDAGYVIGDINPRNALISRYALISLVDTDSYQVTVTRGGQSRVYPCLVGVPEFTPPELQGREFNDVVRGPEHDAFGLAVMIFRLLLNGNHPFRAIQMQGSPHISEGTRIKRGWYPHQPKPPGGVRPPSGGLTIDTLHPDLERLFRRCFVDGHADPGKRPAVSEWARALATAEQSLTRCRKGHEYSNHLSKCPNCQKSAVSRVKHTQRGGVRRRLPVTSPAPGSRNALSGAWRHLVVNPVSWVCWLVWQTVMLPFRLIGWTIATVWYLLTRPAMLFVYGLLLVGAIGLQYLGVDLEDLATYVSEWRSTSIQAVAFSPDGEYLAISEPRSYARIGLQSTNRPSTISYLRRVDVGPRTGGRRTTATSLAHTSNGSFAAGFSDGVVSLWGNGERREQRVDSTGDGPIVGVYFVLHEPYLVSVDRGGTFKLWDLEHERLTQSQRPGRGEILDVDATDDGALLVFGTSEGSVGVWAPTLGEPIFVGTHHYPVEAVAISPSGNLIASAGSAGELALWQPFAGDAERLHEVHQLGATVHQLAFSPDGRYIHVAAGDELIKWDVDRGRRVRARETDGQVTALAVSPTGDLLVLGKRDGSTTFVRIAGRP